MKHTIIVCLYLLMTLSLTAQNQAFVEVSAEAGIDHAFEIDLATFGGGACVIDFDKDGFEDLYVTGGVAPDRLYKNNGDGTFTDVHAAAGFERTYETYTQGAATADINKDGHKDIIVTTMNFTDENRSIAPNLLYLNNGDNTFTEVTAAWGLDNDRVNSMGASFGDINADGFPDLFVGNYFSNSTTGISIYNEQTITNSFQPSIDFLYINVGGERFVDVRTYYGADHFGFGFEGLFTDFDNDQDLDLYIANDFGFKSTPNIMYRNEYPKKKFKDRSIGLALNYGMNAMGIAAADVNFDGWMDYYVTNLGTSLFNINAQNGKPFIDATLSSGVGIPTISDELFTGVPISWGANFFDYDHDTDPDLFVANGALNPTIRPNPNFFFELENGKFTEKAAVVGLKDYQIGRGSVVFDYDNDGDMDIFVINQIPRDPTSTLPEARCLLYRNEASAGNWLKIALEGVDADKNGLGSKIEVIVDGKLLIREIDGGSSHVSQNSTIAHFGLGDATSVASITVKWVGGKTQTIENVAVNQFITIKEEDGQKIDAASDDMFKVSPGFFVDNVMLEYELSESSPVELKVFDSSGRLIETIGQVNTSVNTGFWQWQPQRALTNGVYVFQLITADGVLAKRAVKVE